MGGKTITLVAQPRHHKAPTPSSTSRRAYYDKFSLSSSEDDDDDDDESDESDDSDDSDDSSLPSSDDDSDLSSSDEEDSDDSEDGKTSRGSQHTARGSLANGAADNTLLWPPEQHILKVRFRNGDASQRDAVKRFVTTHYHAIPMRIRFVFLDDHAPGPSNIRIMFNTEKSESYIGRDAERHPRDTTMWLNWHPTIQDPETRRRQRQADVLHEFGHALGMVHEQKHPDCTAKWNYRVLQARHGWSAEKIQRAYEKVDSRRTRLSPYDPKSIMHYPIRPGDALNAVATVPLNRVLSEGDKQFLAAIYPVQQALRLPVKSERGKVVAPKRKPEVKKPKVPEVKKAVVKKAVVKKDVVRKPVVKKSETNSKAVVRRNPGNSRSVVNWNGGNIAVINNSNNSSVNINGNIVTWGNSRAITMAGGGGAMAMVSGGAAGYSSAMAMAGGGNAMAMVSGGPGQFRAWAASGNGSAFASSWIRY